MINNKRVYLSIFSLVIIAGAFVFWNINNELVRKDILRDQIGEIRQEISLVDHYYESCNGAYWAVHTFNGNTNAYKGIEELGQKHIKECASVQNFVEFTNNLIIEPELAGIKDELILMSDLLDDFSTEVIHEENAEVDYRDEADKEIPRQKTRILESIKSIEIKNDL